MTENEHFLFSNQKCVIDDTFINVFRENVRKELEKGMTVRQLSEKADVPYETLKSFLYGSAKDCKLSFALRISSALGMCVDELCETMEKEKAKSIKMIRTMPPQFLKFIRWCIRVNYNRMQTKSYAKTVEVMMPEYGDNLIAKNIYEPIEVSAPQQIVAKTFLGIFVPCEEYMPYLYEGDIVLLANDRKPKDGEIIVVHCDTSFWFVKVSGKNHITLNDNRINNNGEYVGYICFVERR